MSIAVDKSAALPAVDLRARRSRRQGLTIALGDLATVAAAWIVATHLVGLSSGGPVVVPPWLAPIMAAFVAPVIVGVFAVYGLYENDRTRIAVATFDEVKDLFHALVVGVLGLVLVNELLEQVSTWRFLGAGSAVLFVAVALLAVPLARSAVRGWVLPRTREVRTLIVGTGQVANLLFEKLEKHPEYGLNVVGFLDGNPMVSNPPRPILGAPEDIADVVDRMEIDRVIIAFCSSGHEEMLQLVRSIRRPDVQVSIVPRYFEAFTSHATLEDLKGVPVLTLPTVRLSASSRFVKRGFDVSLSAIMLVLLSPVMIAVALAIKLDTRGPVFFRQPRRGRNGSVFTIHKFRSMKVRAEEERGELLHRNAVDGPLFKIKDGDPRVTRVGNVLRKTSLDELPQLWDVLRGSMSLVGPRPFVLYEADLITGWGSRRLDVTPGITGLWQIMGRNDISFDEMVKLDYLYVTNWSLSWDLKILWQTLPGVLRRRGAY